MKYSKDGNQWIEINSDSTNIPADADFRFEVSYRDVPVDLVKDNSHQLYLDGIPAWISTDHIEYATDADGKIIAAIQIKNSKAYIVFDADYLEKNANNTNINGSFYIRGDIEWDKIDTNGGNINLPGLDFTVDFEGNLSQKYGNATIEKSQPELIEIGEGANFDTYLKYTITVTSQEESVIIPEISVTDTFTVNPDFVEEYMSITETSANLASVESERNPYETSTYENAVNGTIAKIPNTKSFKWNIRELNPEEQRTLTYYVKLKKSYVGSDDFATISNSAVLNAGEFERGEDSSDFYPQIDAKISKKKTSEITLDGVGNGEISYKITVSAPETNTYSLVNLRVHDYLPQNLAESITYPDNVILKIRNNETEVTTTQEVTKENGGFDVIIPRLKKGETAEITYKINVKELFLSTNGRIDLTNIANVYSNNDEDTVKKNVEFHSSFTQDWVEKSKMVRKINGGNCQATTIAIPSGDAVYYGKNLVETPDRTFNIPENSCKYQVILNEKGEWDMSATSMKDEFTAENVKYVGYLKIEQFAHTAGGNIGNNADDNTVLSKINESVPTKTVWLNIDGLKNFEFKPSDLGLDKESIYRLTYYAAVDSADGVSKIEVNNKFTIYGNIGYGDSTYHLNSMYTTVSSLLSGSIHYEVKKESWYYDTTVSDKYPQGAVYWVIKLTGELPKNTAIQDKVVQNLELNDDAIVGVYQGDKDLDFSQFENVEEMKSSDSLTALVGSLNNINYKIVQIENLDDLKDKFFSIISTLSDYKGAMLSETVDDGEKGFSGTHSIEIATNTVTSHQTLATVQFEKKSEGKYYIKVDGTGKYINIEGKNNSVSLSNNPQELVVKINNHDGQNYITISHGDYYYLNWFGGSTQKNPKYSSWKDLDNNARHSLAIPVGGEVEVTGSDYVYELSKTNAKITFPNGAKIDDSKAYYAVIKTKATGVGQNKNSNHTLFKNSAGTYNNGNNPFDLSEASLLHKNGDGVMKEAKGAYAYDKDTDTWTCVSLSDTSKRDQYWVKELITESGIYTEWLINVNWDGTMSGLVEVTDYLPNYLEPTSLRLFWSTLKNLTYPEIADYKYDIKWKKFNNNVPFYYNKEENILRFNVGNIQKSEDVNSNNTHVVNMQLICKVTDKDFLMSGESKTITNNVEVNNPENNLKSDDSDKMTIQWNAPLTKIIENDEGNKSNATYNTNKLNFSITANPLGVQIGDEPTLPTLYDVMGAGLNYVPDSLTITSNGETVSGYTLSMEKKDDNTVLIIKNLPNGKKLDIKYNAKINSAPGTKNGTAISNKAYWEGYDIPASSEINKTVSYSFNFDVNFSENPSIILTKKDGDYQNITLAGAVFEIYAVNSAGENTYNTNQTPIDTQTTDSTGKVIFGNNKLSYDQIYKVVEKTPPNGYVLNQEQYYFVFRGETNTEVYPQKITVDGETVTLNATYDGYEHKCVINNYMSPVKVEKIFLDDDGESCEFFKGEYRFGLFDTDPLNNSKATPIQILTITYNDDGSPSYSLDGVTKTEPEFSRISGGAYYVYELDSENKIVVDSFSANGRNFDVSYSVNDEKTNTVTAATGTITVTNKDNIIILPMAGGTGTDSYYLFAVFLVLPSVIFLTIKLKKYYRKNFEM